LAKCGLADREDDLKLSTRECKQKSEGGETERLGRPFGGRSDDNKKERYRPATETTIDPDQQRKCHIASDSERKH